MQPETVLWVTRHRTLFFAYELLETIRIKDCLFLDTHQAFRRRGHFCFAFSLCKKKKRARERRDRDRETLALFTFQMEEPRLICLLLSGICVLQVPMPLWYKEMLFLKSKTPHKPPYAGLFFLFLSPHLHLTGGQEPIRQVSTQELTRRHFSLPASLHRRPYRTWKALSRQSSVKFYLP